ncbi:hypothetical protein EV715DRAFT_298385 [Schizophyllum commune]
MSPTYLPQYLSTDAAAFNGHKRDTRGGVSYTREGVGDHVVGGMDIQESRRDKPGILGKKQNPADDHI